MNAYRLIACTASALLLTACGGGGGGSSAPDISPSAIPTATVSGPDRFLLFPNPQVQQDGTEQTNSLAYPQAYYASIDPANTKDTLTKWKAANGFDSGTGTQTTAVFGDRRDLGYGRRMTARQSPDGSIAFLVENYLVNPGGAYAYSELSLDAAVVQDTRWRILVNAIEYSPASAGGVRFTKFFNFNPATGQRELTVDLDGRGQKAMPGPCISCHGGRADALTPPDAAGRRLFHVVRNTASLARGDVEGRMAPFEVDTFDFSPRAGYTRADQEAALKSMNRLVLCTYPLPAPTGFAEDACRRPANASEWQGTAATLIKKAYGDNGLPNPVYIDTLIPANWLTAGQSTLYREVVVPSCRVCHLLRGNAGNSDIDFESFQKFSDYRDRHKVHVFDRGNMPLAKIVFDTFWSTNKPDTMATFLQGQGISVRSASGAVLQPGRPVAEPGPDRLIRPGATNLSATNSLFASSFVWSIVSGPSGASLSSVSSATPTFNASSNGKYVLQLVAGNGTSQSAPVQVSLVVDNGATTPTPAAIRFANIKLVLRGCVSCHSASGSLPRPPILFGDAVGNDIDRNGDGVVDATDDAWYYSEVRGRINFTDLVASPLLQKAAGKHHGGLLQSGFDTSKDPGDPARASYDLFVNWIANGALQ